MYIFIYINVLSCTWHLQYLSVNCCSPQSILPLQLLSRFIYQRYTLIRVQHYWCNFKFSAGTMSFMDFHQTGFIFNDVLNERPEDPAIFHSRVLIISEALRSFNCQIVHNRVIMLCLQVVFYCWKISIFILKS